MHLHMLLPHFATHLICFVKNRPVQYMPFRPPFNLFLSLAFMVLLVSSCRAILRFLVLMCIRLRVDRLSNQLDRLVDARPLRFTIGYIKHAPWVEHVTATMIQLALKSCRQSHRLGDAPDFKILPILIILPINERREQQDHVPPLIHDRRAAVRAADFARQLVLARLLGAFVPAQVVVPVREVDVFFVEDGAPLERGGW